MISKNRHDTEIYHPVDPDEVFGFLGPGWQSHVTDRDPVFPHPETVAVAVDKHLWEVEKLGYQFLYFKTREVKRALLTRSSHLRSHPIVLFLTIQISNWAITRVEAATERLRNISEVKRDFRAKCKINKLNSRPREGSERCWHGYSRQRC